MFIYLITNVINQKQYIGLTSNTIDFRWRKHVSAARCGSKLLLHAAIRKYGVDSFTRHQLHETDNFNELLELEKQYIAMYNSFDTGYNLTKGGEGSYGRVLSVEAKQRLREQRLGKNAPLTADGRLNISITSKARNSGTGNPMYGKNHTNVTKQKIGKLAHQRMTAPGFIHPMLGKTHSTEVIEKIRKANMGRVGILSHTAKQWVLQGPAGETVTVISLREFCNQHNLKAASIQRTAKTNKPVMSGPSKGWMVVDVITDSTLLEQ